MTRSSAQCLGLVGGQKGPQQPVAELGPTDGDADGVEVRVQRPELVEAADRSAGASAVGHLAGPAGAVQHRGCPSRIHDGSGIQGRIQPPHGIAPGQGRQWVCDELTHPRSGGAGLVLPAIPSLATTGADAAAMRRQAARRHDRAEDAATGRRRSEDVYWVSASTDLPVWMVTRQERRLVHAGGSRRTATGSDPPRASPSQHRLAFGGCQRGRYLAPRFSLVRRPVPR